jgi:hypothetical protein
MFLLFSFLSTHPFDSCLYRKKRGGGRKSGSLNKPKSEGGNEQVVPKKRKASGAGLQPEQATVVVIDDDRSQSPSAVGIPRFGGDEGTPGSVSSKKKRTAVRSCHSRAIRCLFTVLMNLIGACLSRDGGCLSKS